MKPMRRQTPQQKKANSYSRDCRYRYGNNHKAARGACKLARARTNRAARLKLRAQLRSITGPTDAEHDAVQTERAETVKRRRWRKTPDRPLGVVVAAKLLRRAFEDGKITYEEFCAERADMLERNRTYA